MSQIRVSTAREFLEAKHGIVVSADVFKNTHEYFADRIILAVLDKACTVAKADGRSILSENNIYRAMSQLFSGDFINYIMEINSAVLRESQLHQE